MDHMSDLWIFTPHISGGYSSFGTVHPSVHLSVLTPRVLMASVCLALLAEQTDKLDVQT